MGQGHVGVCADPSVMVRPANAAGFQLDNSAIRRAVGIRNILDPDGCPVLVKQCGLHGLRCRFGQRLIQIGNQVVGVLDPDGNPHHTGAGARRFLLLCRQLAMGR